MNTRSILIWGGFIGGLVLLIFLLAQFGSGNKSLPAPSHGGGIIEGVTLATDVDEKEHIKGNNPAITLVEYSDFQCPACATTYPIVKRLAESYSEQIRFVYRHYPLRQIHPNAQLAAQASEAAGLQGKFWEMHDALFNTQASWSNERNPKDFFIELAESLSLDMEKFEQDLESSETKNAVNEDYSSGSRSGVPGTPTFYINGQRLQNPGSYAGFERIIEELLEQNAS